MGSSALCVGEHPARRLPAACGARKRRQGLCALEGRFRQGFVQYRRRPVRKPPFEQGRQCTKSGRPLRAWSRTETVPRPAGPCTLPGRRVRKPSKTPLGRVRSRNVVYGKRPKPRWAVYGNRRKVRTTGCPHDQKAYTTCRQALATDADPGLWQRRPPATTTDLHGSKAGSRRSATHTKCRSPRIGVTPYRDTPVT